MNINKKLQKKLNEAIDKHGQKGLDVFVTLILKNAVQGLDSELQKYLKSKDDSYMMSNLDETLGHMSGIVFATQQYFAELMSMCELVVADRRINDRLEIRMVSDKFVAKKLKRIITENDELMMAAILFKNVFDTLAFETTMLMEEMMKEMQQDKEFFSIVESYYEEE